MDSLAPHRRWASKRSWRRLRSRSAGIVFPLAILACGSGCDDQIAKEFRDAAVSQIETGVNAIFDGVISGVFAVLEPDTDSSS